MLPRIFMVLVALLFLQACSDSNNDGPGGSIGPGDDPVFAADIVWTEFGIPHVTADDWAGLGYGYGYAFARENFCVVMREIVISRGESARYLGDDGDIDSDFLWKLYNNPEALERIQGEISDRVEDLITGYVAGLNRYVDETGVDNLPEGDAGCRGAEWVREVTVEDMAAFLHKLILRASADPLTPLIVAAEPNEAVVSVTPSQIQTQLQALTPELIAQSLPIVEPTLMGSNAYAVGGDASATGSGILFGNPHFPWQGSNRFFMSQLTIPGEYNISGGSLFGVPLVLIGFTENLAWSHTVSTGQRFTFYELTLNPANPLEYEYDGEMREIETVTVAAENVTEGGDVVTEEHTFYITQYGPMVDLGLVDPLLGGWPNFTGTAFAYRDANLENVRGFDQWINMAQAEDMTEFVESLGDIGIPWVNTIAADRNGNALYADISAIPNLTQAQIDNCVRGFLAPLLTEANRTTLDGSDSDCEWGNDEGAPPGVLGLDSLPRLQTQDYGANANDSYWLPNPRNLITGFPTIIGRENIEQTLRTRLTFTQFDELQNGLSGFELDGTITKQQLMDLSYSARNYAQELVREDVVALCSGVADWALYTTNTAQAAEACDVIDTWDGRHQVDSVGGHVFYEFWREARDIENLWAVPFDPADPVNTPNTLNDGDPAVQEDVLQAFAVGVDELVDAGIAIDIPWGEVQFAERNGVRLPIHGGSGSMLFSVISSDLVDGEGYSNIRAGNSYMQTVTWDDTACPDAAGMLTYSQSTDPASPHYADATELYGDGEWIDMAFCEADIEATEISRASISTED